MSEARRERIKDIHARALDLADEERAAFLVEACGGDEELREEVMSLLRARRTMGSFLETSATERLGIFARDPPVLAAGDRVGGYRIVEPIGTGGGGTVYEALQTRPHRRVALKVMRTDLASATARRSFEGEAEILARLKHPDVAHVYEAGVHEVAGIRLPYIAMEHVEGARTVLAYAQDEGLSVRERVGLVARICDAVHHGHQKGIIHRDLKPGNVLVDSAGRPKIIDFGIARVVDAGASPEPEVVGTLAYMSPERLSRGEESGDVRGDVYALGTLLFEILTGRVPHDVAGLPLAEAMRRIREEPPGSLASIDGRFRGDLDAIVAKALSTDRDLRYGSAAALANDLRRHLAHRPVEARPPRPLYLLRRAARRHRLAFAALAILLLVSLAAAIVSSRLAVTSRRHAREAERQRRAADLGRREAEWQAYVASIAGAEAALRVHDVAEARQCLERAPAAHRDWEWRHLEGRVDGSLRTLARSDSRGWIRLGAMSADGRVLAFQRVRTGCPSITEVWLREPPSLHRAVPETGDPADIADVLALSRDGALLAEGRRSGAIVIADTASGAVRHVLAGHEGFVIAARFAPDGETLATGSRDRTIRLWRMSDGSPMRVLRGHPDRVIGLAFTPDGESLVSGSRDGDIRIWRVASGEHVRTLLGHEGSVESVAVSPDGRRLASCSRDRTVRLWDLRDGTELARGFGHDHNVRDVAFSPDGRRVATVSYDRTVRLWSADDARSVATLCGHTGLGRRVAFLPDGSRLITWADDAVKEWSAVDRDEIPTLRGHDGRIAALSFRRDGRRLASASADGTVRIWDPAAGREVAVLSRYAGPVNCVAYLGDGSRLAAGGEGGGLWLWASPFARPDHADSAGHVYDVVTSRDGRRVFLSAGGGYRIDLRDGTTGRRIRRQRAGDARVTALALSPDETVLASGSCDGTIRTFDATTLELRGEARAQEDGILTLAYLPDGDRVVVAGQDGRLRIVDSRSLAVRRVLEGHSQTVLAVAISPNGRRIASASADNTIRFWDASTGRPVCVFRGHRHVVSALAFSPDGRYLASGTGDWEVPAEIRLWEVPARDRESPARPSGR